MPRTKTIRPAERYLVAGGEEARRLGHSFIGTQHVLAVLVRDPDGGATRSLGALGVSVEQVRQALSGWLEERAPTGKIDPEALASFGIDFEVVRERLEQSFGPGALARTRSACLGIAPRLKLALVHALDFAAESPLADEHVLRGLLSVPDSVAARALGSLGVSAEDVRAIRGPEPSR
jgi:ATP-dependent Clp protease ATP-binding subunit ClpA